MAINTGDVPDHVSQQRLIFHLHVITLSLSGSGAFILLYSVTLFGLEFNDPVNITKVISS